MRLSARLVMMLAGLACAGLPEPATLFAAVPVSAFATADDYLVDVWTSENGLPDSSVTAITQTPDGYLWIGTYNGLVQFDGVHFVTFDPVNEPALKHAHVRQLYVDPQGTLWVNTYGGSLTALRHGTFVTEISRANSSEADLVMVASSSGEATFLTSRGNLLRRTWREAPDRWRELFSPKRGLNAACCADRQGTLWYLGNDQHLWRLQGDQFEPLPATAGLAGQAIHCLTADERQRVWVSTDKGFYFWDGSRFQDATPASGGGREAATALCVAGDGQIWAVVDGCVCEAAERRWIIPPGLLRDKLPGRLDRVELQADHHGGIWLYNYGRGLTHVSSTGMVRQLAVDDGFPDLRVYCLFEDREGSWWAGLDSGGLARVREREFHVLSAGGRPMDEATKSVTEAADGAVWIGSLNGGLGRWQDGGFTNANPTHQPEANAIFCACEDARGQLWLSAGDDEELYVRAGGRLAEVSPGIRGVKAILAARGGRLWVGTKSGLYFKDPGGLFQLCKGVPKHYVRALAQDEAGVVWAGTGNGDLYRIEGGVISTFRPAGDDASEAIWSLLPDQDHPGVVWVGTFRGGLLRFQDGTFTRYGESEGLPDNVICQILEDDHTNLWLGSHQGIFRVAARALDEVARGKTNFVSCTVYGRSDGLPSLECSGGYQPAAWRCRDGTLWFTTMRGAVWVQPGRLHSDRLPPPVVIEAVLLDGRNKLNPGPGQAIRAGFLNRPSPVLEIPPGRHQIEIRYTGLSLVSPGRVLFRHLLAGVDADWTPAGTQRFAQYNYLPPGAYRFRVVACNGDGVWNETGSTLTLRILPHFYETWWFRALAVLAVIGAVAAAVRSSVTRRLRRKMELLERQQAVERERARIAKDIHDDLGASLNLIAVLGDLAKQDRAVERIGKMSSTARQAVKSLDEIVWAVNPRNDTLPNLIDYLCQFATDYLRDAGIRCRLDVPEQAAGREVPASVRHNLFLVLKEALQNVVKHARASQVELRIGASATGLRIEITDNGRGFAGQPGNAGTDGLNNMRQRLAEIGGECIIRSHEGMGTTITAEVRYRGQAGAGRDRAGDGHGGG